VSAVESTTSITALSCEPDGRDMLFGCQMTTTGDPHATAVLDLPQELLTEICRNLKLADLVNAGGICRLFRKVRIDCLERQCRERWPDLWSKANSAISSNPSLYWAKLIKMLEMRDDECTAVIAVHAALDAQGEISSRARAILVEWLLEVTFVSMAHFRALLLERRKKARPFVF
jgi:hypothetical protein